MVVYVPRCLGDGGVRAQMFRDGCVRAFWALMEGMFLGNNGGVESL